MINIKLQRPNNYAYSNITYTYTYTYTWFSLQILKMNLFNDLFNGPPKTNQNQYPQQNIGSQGQQMTAQFIQPTTNTNTSNVSAGNGAGNAYGYNYQQTNTNAYSGNNVNQQGWNGQVQQSGWQNQNTYNNTPAVSPSYNNATYSNTIPNTNPNTYYSQSSSVSNTKEQGFNLANLIGGGDDQEKWREHQGWGNSYKNVINNSHWGKQQPVEGYSMSPVALTSQGAPPSKLRFDPNKQYQFITALGNSNMVLSMTPQNHANGNLGVLAAKSNTLSQKFKITEQGNNKCIINCLHLNNPNAVLQIKDAQSIKGGAVSVGQFSGQIHQYFQILSAGTDKQDEYYIKTFCGKCWDVCQQKLAQGTPIIQYDYNGGRNQVWLIRPI